MNTQTKVLVALLAALGAACIVKLALSDAQAAVPSDPLPAVAFGQVGVVCDDGGTNHATPIPASPRSGNGLFIQNLDTVAIYCGADAGVTSDTGVQVAGSGGTFSVDVKFTGIQWYCTKAACNGATVANQATTGTANTRWVGVK